MSKRWVRDVIVPVECRIMIVRRLEGLLSEYNLRNIPLKTLAESAYIQGWTDAFESPKETEVTELENVIVW